MTATEIRRSHLVADLFFRNFGSAPDGVWSAPGRVNLIGEHTDYNDGLVLPFAIDARTSVAVGVADGGLSVVSAQQPGVIRADAARLDPRDAGAHDWAGYVFGVVWALAQEGHRIPGLRIAVDSTVPVGAGLSSSAALECAVVLALSDLCGLDLTTAEIAVIAQRAENEFVGVPCGLMDQMASAACTEDHLLFFDMGSGEIEQVPFDPAAEGCAMLLIDTRVKHALTDGEYANRRASCRAAAGALGVDSLRDITVADLPGLAARLRPELLRRRVRHVVTEIDRVATTVALLRARRLTEIGPLMLASHVSLRDDYEVSDPALDLAVDAAMAAGALGARMTGGGFGGSVIALVPAAAVGAIGGAVQQSMVERGFSPKIRTVLPGPGASCDWSNQPSGPEA